MATSKYTALHAAFWSGGFFLYIPQGVEIEAPILAQVWLDASSSAGFTHTLIIAEPQSSVRFVEEYTSKADAQHPSLLSDVVELYAKNEARIEFSNLQDLDQNTWNISNKNALYEKDGSVTYVAADLGSKVTLSTLGSGLKGNGSAGELVGVFFTDNDQRYSINTLSDHAGTLNECQNIGQRRINRSLPRRV